MNTKISHSQFTVNEWTQADRILFDPTTPLLYNFLVARRPTHFYGTATNWRRAQRVLALTALGAGYSPELADEIAFFRLRKPTLRQAMIFHPTPPPVTYPTFAPPTFQPLTVSPVSHGVTFMGCNTLFDGDTANAYSSFIYWRDGQGLWVDPWPGTNWPVEKYVSAYYLSHLHPDHVFGVLERLAAAVRSGQPMVLYAHSQLWAPLTELFRVYYPTLKPLTTHRSVITFLPIDTGNTFAGATIHPFRALHSLPTYGFLIKAEGVTLGFTGDHCHQEATFDELRQYLTHRRGWRVADADARLDYLRYHLSTCDVLIHDAGEASLAHHPRLYRPVHTVPTDIPVRPGQAVWLTHYSPSVMDRPPHPQWRLAQSGESCLFA